MSTGTPDGTAPPRAERPGALVDRAFSRRAALWLAAAAGLSLLATLVLPVVLGDTPEEVTRAPNAYSRSAVGHHAFVAVLRELGLPVLVSRYRSASRSGPDQPLIIAEPADHDEAELEAMVAEGLGRGAAVVVVLPKWDPDSWDPPKGEEGAAGASVPGLSAPEERAPSLVPEAEVTRVLWAAERGLARHWGQAAPAEAYGEDVVLRGAPAAAWDGPLAARGRPQLAPLQALALRDYLVTALGAGERVVIGGWADATGEPMGLWVLTDPELFNTMGLGAGDNAVLAWRFFVDTLGARGLVFDEVVHGFKRPPSIWSDLFTFPLVVVTFHLAGLLLLALWAAGARFGKPEPLPPRIAAGKGALIANTANLLAVGGHAGYTVREYLRATLRAVARDLALPPHLGDDERLATLTRLAAERGVAIDPSDLAHRAAQVGDRKRDARRALALARRIYRFRQEMCDGQRQHRRD